MSFNWINWDHPLVRAHDYRPDIERTIALWRRYIKPGDHCVDVGAWIGDTTVAMSVLSGASGYVSAFEPNPGAFKVLQQNVKQPAECAPIVAHMFGISDREGPATFHYCDAGFLNGGALLLGRELLIKHTFPLEVQVARLDAHLTPKVRFIKLDTEGNDLRILKDNEAFLRQWRPVVQFELYPDATRAERQEHIDFLAAIGYRFEFDGTPVDDLGKLLDQHIVDIVAICANPFTRPIGSATESNSWPTC